MKGFIEIKGFNMNFIDTVSEILKHFPDPNEWTINTYRANNNYVWIDGDKDRYIVMRRCSNKVSISGGWPSDPSSSSSLRPSEYKLNEPQISFSILRNPKALAKDINRRFLVKYEDTFTRLLVEQKKIKDRIYNNRLIIEALQRVFDLSEYVYYNAYSPKFHVNKKHILKFNSDGTFDLNLKSVSIECCFKALSSSDK